MHEMSTKRTLALLVCIAMASLLGRMAIGQLPQPSSQPPPQPSLQPLPQPSLQPPPQPLPQPPGQPLPQPPSGYRGQVISGQGNAMDMTDPLLRNPALPPGSTNTPVIDARDPRATAAMTCTNCHDRSPVPIGANDSPGSGFEGESLSPRSWAAWWEVHREAYLMEARASRPNAIDRRSATVEVITALKSAAKSPSAAVRAEALLALGRVHATDSLDLLIKATGDSDSTAALRAWTAIGLLDTAQARQFLATAPPAGGEARIGWTVAVGLLKEPTDAMWQTVGKQVDEPDASAEAQRLAIWAMRLHGAIGADGTHEMLLRTINTSPNRVLVAEAIAGLPPFRNPNDLQFLADIVRGEGATTRLAVIAKLGSSFSPVATPSGQQQYYGPSLDPAESLSFDPDSTRDVVAVRRVTPEQQKRADARNEYLFVREAAVRALGEFGIVGADVRRAIAEPVLYSTRGVPRHFLPQDMLALAKIGQIDDYYGLADRLEVNLLPHPGFPEPTASDRMKRPSRGNAAIAIGLLLDELGGGLQTVPDTVPLQAPVPVHNGVSPAAAGLTRRGPNSPRGPFTRDGLGGRTVVATASPLFMVPRTNPDLLLYTNYRKTDESSEVRSASVMGLAIGGQRQRAGEIKRSLPELRENDGAIFGYSLLALGLWGDSEAVALAARQLPAASESNAVALTAKFNAIKPAKMPLSQVLARRATAQGMATLGDARAIPMLINQWGHNPAVDVELSRAIAWCRPEGGTTSSDLAGEFGHALASLLSKDPTTDRAASAAASLGALYDQDAIKRLSSLVMGETFLSRGQPLDESGRMNLKAPQRAVLGLANPHYFLTAFAEEGRR